MALTSVKLNGLELLTPSSYQVHQSTIPGLFSAPSREPVMVERPGTYPVWVRSQILPKTIPLSIILMGTTRIARKALFSTLSTAATTGTLVPLLYILDGLTYTYQVHCSGPITDEWFFRVTIETVAPNPVPVVT